MTEQLQASMVAAEVLNELHVARMARALLLIAAARADMHAEELLSRGLQQEARLAAEELCREGSD